MVGLTCCYVLLLKMVLIRTFVANPANVVITRFFVFFFTQKNRILAEIVPKKLAAGGSARNQTVLRQILDVSPAGGYSLVSSA